MSGVYFVCDVCRKKARPEPGNAQGGLPEGWAVFVEGTQSAEPVRATVCSRLCLVAWAEEARERMMIVSAMVEGLFGDDDGEEEPWRS